MSKELTEEEKGKVRVIYTMMNIPIPEWAMSDTDKPKPDTDKENHDDNT